MAARTAKTGEGVLCDGQMHLVMETKKQYNRNTGEPVHLVIYENKDRRVLGLLADLRWDDELEHWCLWGQND